MPAKSKNLLGKRFGRYTVTAKNSDNSNSAHIKRNCLGAGQLLKDRLKDAMRLLEQYPDEAQTIRIEEYKNILENSSVRDKIDPSEEVLARAV